MHHPRRPPPNGTLLRHRRRRSSSRGVGRAVPGFGRARSEVRRGSLQRPPRGAPPTRFNAPVSARRVTDACRVSLNGLKRIKAIVPGATVNDVVLAVFAGGLREYLASKG